MSKYRIKKGTLKKPLSDVPNEMPNKAPLLEEEAEEQGAFFTGEDSTKVFNSSDVDAENDKELSELFGVSEEKKKSRVKLNPFVSKNKAESGTLEELIQEADTIYSGEQAERIDETVSNERLKPFLELSEKKTVKKLKDDVDGENDEYETEAASLDGLFSAVELDDDDDDDDYEHKSAKKAPVIEEYTSPNEREEFICNYRRRSRNALTSALLCLAFTILLFLHESPSFPHPEWLTQGKYGILYLLFDLQCLAFAGVFTHNVFVSGARALFKWKPNKHSVAFVLETVAVLQILLHLFFDRSSEATMLFSSIAAFSAFICAMANYFDVRREGIAFRTVSADTPKFIAKPLDDTSSEYTAFDQYLPEDAYLYSLEKTEFVKGFAATSRKESSFNEIYRIILPLLIFTSVLFAVIANIMSGAPTFGRTLDNLVLALMISTPIFSVLTVSLPFLKGTTILARSGSAVIGEESLDTCSATNVIAFKDTDAFHAKGILLSSVKPFGTAQMDTAIFTAARVFNLAGGPLRDVFNRSIIDPGSSGTSESDELVQVLPNSITALIDERKVLLGTRLAAKSQGAVCPDDPIDSMFEGSGGRIMYMLIDEELAAKFYIKYSLGRNFKSLLDSFCDAGTFMVIKSCDPNLDTEYLTRLLHDDNYPIVVNKLNHAEYAMACETSEQAETPIVSNKSTAGLLRAFKWCDKCRHIINLNNLARFVAIVLSVIILIACLLNANAHEKITPMLVLLYQLIWALPIFGTSLFQ